jgi:hypothetical protein
LTMEPTSTPVEVSLVFHCKWLGLFSATIVQLLLEHRAGDGEENMMRKRIGKKKGRRKRKRKVHDRITPCFNGKLRVQPLAECLISLLR